MTTQTLIIRFGRLPGECKCLIYQLLLRWLPEEWNSQFNRIGGNADLSLAVHPGICLGTNYKRHAGESTTVLTHPVPWDCLVLMTSGADPLGRRRREPSTLSVGAYGSKSLGPELTRSCTKGPRRGKYLPADFLTCKAHPSLVVSLEGCVILLCGPLLPANGLGMSGTPLRNLLLPAV